MVTNFFLLIEDTLFETQSYTSGLPLDCEFLEESTALSLISSTEHHVKLTINKFLFVELMEWEKTIPAHLAIYFSFCILSYFN